MRSHVFVGSWLAVGWSTGHPSPNVGFWQMSLFASLVWSSWASLLFNLFTSARHADIHLVCSFNTSHGFGVGDCNSGFLLLGMESLWLHLFCHSHHPSHPSCRVAIMRSRMGTPAWRPPMCPLPSPDGKDMWVRQLTRQRGQGTRQGGSQLAQPIYFIFRHIKHTITMTVVINLILRVFLWVT